MNITASPNEKPGLMISTTFSPPCGDITDSLTRP